MTSHAVISGFGDGETAMTSGPKHSDKQRHPDDATDVPPGSIDKETVEIETENAVDDAAPEEQVEQEGIEPPMFEE